MTGSASDSDIDSVRRRLAVANERADDSVGSSLESIVVRYEHRPDRCTITPRECPDSERLTTWLSADVDAFVALDDAR